MLECLPFAATLERIQQHLQEVVRDLPRVRQSKSHLKANRGTRLLRYVDGNRKKVETWGPPFFCFVSSGRESTYSMVNLFWNLLSDFSLIPLTLVRPINTLELAVFLAVSNDGFRFDLLTL